MKDNRQWVKEAACRGKDINLWFPEVGLGAQTAKKICKGCPVNLQCLAYAVQNPDIVGIWGGTAHRDRAAIRRQLGLINNSATRVALFSPEEKSAIIVRLQAGESPHAIAKSISRSPSSIARIKAGLLIEPLRELIEAS
jgi:hypothetical protein